MATKVKPDSIASNPAGDQQPANPGPKLTPATQRKIPGNLPYLTASGTLKKALDRLIEAARPPKFNSDFLENVLKLTSGTARSAIPILKKMGFLTSDGIPTDLYDRFRTESGRPNAALLGLRSAFPEIFKRSEYAHSVGDAKLRDIVTEITGLIPNDPVAVAIRGTFNVIKNFIPDGFNSSSSDDNSGSDESSLNSQAPPDQHHPESPRSTRNNLGLVYNINIVLPETSDLKVLNAIFRSLKENLMQ